MLVIGSKNSSNTKELYNLSIENCNEVYFIETIDDLTNIKIENNKKIGVVAGASAPRYLIDEVVNYLKENNNEN